ncbi:MAG: hypothetical protein ABIY37_14465 [Devosia sp.]
MLFSYAHEVVERMMSFAQWGVWQRVAVAAVLVALIWLVLWGLL